MPTPVLPNPKVAARTGLLAQTALTALVAQRIYYAIPANPTFPLIVLTVIDDDEAARPDALTARVQADVWGAGNSTQDVLDTEAIVAVLRSVARNLVGTWGSASIFSAVAGQAIPNPDTTTGRARTIVDLLIDLQ